MSDIPTDRAVVDQIVDGTTALLLVGPDQQPLNLPAGQLPKGAGEGTWLTLTLAVDHELTAARTSENSDRLNKLRQTRSSGRFAR